LKILFGSGIGYNEVYPSLSISLAVKKDYGEVWTEAKADNVLSSMTDDCSVYLVTLKGEALMKSGNLVEKYKITTLNKDDEEDDDE